MAQRKVSETPNQKSAAEIQELYAQNQKVINDFAKANDAVKILKDLDTNMVNRRVSVFSKEELRSYLQNISNNANNLISLSRYLDYRSQVYHRIIKYFANMLCMEARIVIPPFSLTETESKEETLKIYEDSLLILNRLNLQYEMFKAAVVCWREDVFFGCNYFDDTGHFIYPLDPQYCRIMGIYSTGDFAFAMDMTYFRSRQKLLEELGEPFTTLYRAYGGDNTKRWQPFPDEYAVCFKIRSDDWETIAPPLTGIFNSLINLVDLEDLQAIADEQDIYRLVWLELETITGSKDPDDWKVDPSIVVRYFNRMLTEALPAYTSGAIVPGKLQTIDFSSSTDKASDTTKVQKATESVLNTSGGAQILNAAAITGSTGLNLVMKADTEYAISSLLPQIQAWVNRFLSYQVSKPCKVRFFEVSAYTKGELKKELLESATYGLPNRLALNSLMGINELETLSMLNLEIDVLNLHKKMVPVSSSYTMSGNIADGGGRPESDDTEITDDGEASRDKADKAN